MSRSADPLCAKRVSPSVVVALHGHSHHRQFCLNLPLKIVQHEFGCLFVEMLGDA